MLRALSNKTNPPNVKICSRKLQRADSATACPAARSRERHTRSRSTSATTSRVTPEREDPSAMRIPIFSRAAPSSRRALHQDQGVFGYSLSLTELALCYSYFVLRKKGVRASQAKTPHGLGVWPETAIRFSPPQTFLFDPEAALVALAGRPVIGRVSPCSSSASIPDSNAD